MILQLPVMFFSMVLLWKEKTRMIENLCILGEFKYKDCGVGSAKL